MPTRSPMRAAGQLGGRTGFPWVAYIPSTPGARSEAGCELARVAADPDPTAPAAGPGRSDGPARPTRRRRA
eukprot:6233268-Pyramimonas_sp.AAC.1